MPFAQKLIAHADNKTQAQNVPPDKKIQLQQINRFSALMDLMKVITIAANVSEKIENPIADFLPRVFVPGNDGTTKNTYFLESIGDVIRSLHLKLPKMKKEKANKNRDKKINK